MTHDAKSNTHARTLHSITRTDHPLSIVVVAPHPDDAELGMGGTIARLVDEGHRVTVVDLTDGEPTPCGNHEKRMREARAADAILGSQRINLGLRNRELAHTLEYRHALAAVLRHVRCEVMFVPHPDDAHPDHVAASAIARDARFDAKLTQSSIPGEPVHPKRLFHYFCTHLKSVQQPSFALDITAWMSRKRDAILAYQSQVLDHPPNRTLPSQVEARDRYFGSRIGVEAAEPFWSAELLAPRTLDALV
jgi:bacillithiol biosynthesis deacetylase BshB1